MEKKLCTSCQHKNPSYYYYCTHCGSKLCEDNNKYARLCLILGKPKGAIFLLNKKKNTIGRDWDSNIVLADNQVSNKHAVIKHEDNIYWIEDLNSKNGVYVDEKKIKTERLANGSIIRMGSTILMIEIDN
jgi:tetrahydrodipicolinate N-succinyltransferase